MTRGYLGQGSGLNLSVAVSFETLFIGLLEVYYHYWAWALIGGFRLMGLDKKDSISSNKKFSI